MGPEPFWWLLGGAHLQQVAICRCGTKLTRSPAPGWRTGDLSGRRIPLQLLRERVIDISTAGSLASQPTQDDTAFVACELWPMPCKPWADQHHPPEPATGLIVGDLARIPSPLDGWSRKLEQRL